MAAAAVASLIAVAPAAAQVGAIGGAPGAVAAGSGATARAPVFGESALVMPKGSWSAGMFGAYASGGFDAGFGSTDFSFTQVLVGAFFAPSDRLTIGASLFPYVAVDVTSDFGSGDESGRGDGSLYAKYQIANSGNTSVAGALSIGLPIGDDNFGDEGASFGVAGIVSHTADRVSIHGALGVTVPTDELDGETTINFNGALMYAAQENLTIGIEMLGSTFSIEEIDERFTSIDIAPGARLRAGERVYLDAGLLFNASTSPGESLLDYGFIIGATITR
jgi:hypothetical protein